MRAHFLQERAVGRRVAGKPLDEQALQAIFACAHAVYTPYSLLAGIRLQGAEKIQPGRILHDPVTISQFGANYPETALSADLVGSAANILTT
jgi:hypothetical protein